MTQNTMNHTPGVPLDPYTKLADTVLRFASAVEDLLKDELAYPFSIGSEALRDHAANEQHPGTKTRDALTGLSGNQIRAVGVQCDLLRGIAALLPVPKVFFAPFPLARTCAVAAAKAWFILGGATLEERLQRYLNEELDALYRTPWDFGDPGSQADIATRTADYVAIGATAGLRPARKKNAKDWDAPYLVRSGQGRRDGPPSETEVVRDMFAAAGLGQQSGLPYTLLSAATHSRFGHAGVSEAIPTGRSVNGVPTRAMHSSPGTTAKVTVLAAIATRTHLRRLAWYANVPELWVQDRLGGALAEWCAIGGVPVPE
ncbi:hypothetical protein FZI91_01915 [Mycobacterium sp. CBMA271]|uniref:hypothetical protein n=1 Tax=unclassified Mycobacteroides TaxID=2618759 RepID=UPI0012DEEF10|nr:MULTISPECIES: hypothetical protein [unclassified Mycobacteroides]MUM17893.1 hypothetical protein [Mycobacteroides sp. CBMA 326]MUM20463.1 hypothetical protein [Mycobacteroides sp. CBMA 271]